MNKSVFNFNDYLSYLSLVLDSKGKKRGAKSAAAEAMQIQPTYLSQVFTGSAHLSLEQADLLNQHLLHNDEEAHYFLLLVQKDRAATKHLRAYFLKQINSVLERRMNLTQRLGGQNTLNEEEKQRYYSSWIYAAVHIAVTISNLRTKKALCDFLNIEHSKINGILDFLERAGLVRQENGTYHPGHSSIRLGNESHNIIKHHTNWRSQAIESLERESINDLHYSAVVSLSKKDAFAIKDKIFEHLKEYLEIIKPSPEEELMVLNIDFFNLRKKID